MPSRLAQARRAECRLGRSARSPMQRRAAHQPPSARFRRATTSGAKARRFAAGSGHNRTFAMSASARRHLDLAAVQVWDVDDPEWTCKIDEGPAGASLRALRGVSQSAAESAAESAADGESCRCSLLQTRARPDERGSAAGVAHTRWCPSGRQILVVADFGLRCGVWDIERQTCRHLAGPKHTDRGFAFGAAHGALAVAEVVLLTSSRAQS